MVGVTIFDNANGTAGNSLSTLYYPWGISINSDNSMLISDTNNNRLLHVLPNTTTGIVVANSTSLLRSRRAIYDGSLLNLFFMDSKCAMRNCYNGSFNSTVLFGGQCGSSLTLFQNKAGFYIDSAGNFYIADNLNHRILYWPVNSTNTTVIAGISSVLGNDSLHLYHPQDIVVNKTQGVFYVDDSYNHRIMRYTIGSLNGTVVAGGNGPGDAQK